LVWPDWLQAEWLPGVAKSYNQQIPGAARSPIAVWPGWDRQGGIRRSLFCVLCCRMIKLVLLGLDEQAIRRANRQ
tara:strand:- start:17746 stop:17970 length:225 start_codon:yes stop_codon:yes gene_type:complete